MIDGLVIINWWHLKQRKYFYKLLAFFLCGFSALPDNSLKMNKDQQL